MLFKIKSLSFIAKLARSWPIIALLIISIFLVIANHTPGTYLSGWDTLHPEFNFSLNFERTINGVFRTEQGLGAVAGHSHMADLPRIFILYVAHFILPQSFLRYFYIDLCLILGPIGMYLFLNKRFFKKRTISFLGALFYLLNLGTVQTFNVPFEMFTTLYATLPFIFLFAHEYFFEKKDKRKNLLFFAIWVLLASPSAYAATLWYIFFFIFTLYFFIQALFFREHDKKSFIHFITLILVMLIVNLFWLVPSIYFIFTHGTEVAKANINLLFSDQAFLKNKEFGNLTNILLLKSFYFDWKIYALNNQFIDLLPAFINHLKNPLVLIIGYLFSAIFILGGIYHAAKEKLKSLPVFAVILVCLLFLFNDNLPFSPLYDFFQNHIPFFKEALRFPDDKILNVFIFFVSILFAYGLEFITDKINKISHKLQPEIFLTFIFSFLLIAYTIPAFSGNLINPLMRVQIPNSYFDLFNYLNSKPASLRVSNFPVNSPWGWVYYDWYEGQKPSFQGAGFLYFGIKQPLLDRDFDRWSPFNESYYREASYALYKQDAILLTNTLNKYKIGFIFVDKNVINPQSSSIPLYFEQSENLLNKTGLVTDKKTFGNIDLYQLASGDNPAFAINTNINVLPKSTTTNEDFAYEHYGNYLTSAGISDFTNILYPFRNLITNQSKLLSNIVSEDNNNITLTPNLTSESFQTGQISESLKTIIADLTVTQNSNSLNVTFNPNVPVLNNLALSIPKSQTISVPGSSSNLFLSVNENDPISLKNIIPGYPTPYGKIKLENGNNTISVFDLSSVTPVENAKQLINPFFSSCSDNGESPTAGILANGVKLTGTGDLCIIIPYGYLPKIDGQNTSVITGFQFDFTGTANITSCLLNVENSNCLAYKDPILSGQTMTFIYPFKAADKQKMALKIILKPVNQGENTYVLYNINSWYSKSISSINLNKDFINSMFLGSQNASFNKLVFPKSNIYKPEVELTKTHLINDCKALNAKKEIVELNGTKTIKYTSLNGSFCDFFSYPNLAHNQGYLISISSKNVSGLPLTLCISNYTSRKCDIYADLKGGNNNNKDYFLLPPSDENGTGYDINFENLGIKGTSTINYLASLEVMPMPYSFIENIKSEQNTSSEKFLTGKIQNLTVYSPGLILAGISAPTILTLNESFENGFKAYSIACNMGISCFIKASLAPLFAAEIKTHVLVNNWANGWIIKSSDLKQANTKIVIAYLPQTFEYLGFLALLLIFIALLIHKFIEKHS